MRKCERCHEREAEWAAQWIASDRVSLTLLGWHYRGFPVLRLCDECKEELLREEEDKREEVNT